MTLETGDLLQSILDSLDRIDYIRPDDIPDIELYMDQVTTFMDSRLKNAARNPEVDKILTKTMINNYAKKRPAAAARPQEIFPRAHAAFDFYLLFQGHPVNQRHSDRIKTDYRPFLCRKRRAEA